MRPHQGSVEGKENLPRPAGHTLLDAPQDPMAFLAARAVVFAPHCRGKKRKSNFAPQLSILRSTLILLRLCCFMSFYVFRVCENFYEAAH